MYCITDILFKRYTDWYTVLLTDWLIHRQTRWLSSFPYSNHFQITIEMASQSASEQSVDVTDIEKFPESDRANVKVIASELHKKYPNGKVAVKDHILYEPNKHVIWPSAIAKLKSLTATFPLGYFLWSSLAITFTFALSLSENFSMQRVNVCILNEDSSNNEELSYFHRIVFLVTFLKLFLTSSMISLQHKKYRILKKFN